MDAMAYPKDILALLRNLQCVSSFIMVALRCRGTCGMAVVAPHVDVAAYSRQEAAGLHLLCPEIVLLH
jgi:hypothetical protein